MILAEAIEQLKKRLRPVSTGLADARYAEYYRRPDIDHCSVWAEFHQVRGGVSCHGILRTVVPYLTHATNDGTPL